MRFLQALQPAGNIGATETWQYSLENSSNETQHTQALAEVLASADLDNLWIKLQRPDFLEAHL